MAEKSQVAWIGASRLAHTDVLKAPVSLPLTDVGPDVSRWPSLSRQKSVLLSKILATAAKKLLSALRSAKADAAKGRWCMNRSEWKCSMIQALRSNREGLGACQP